MSSLRRTAVKIGGATVLAVGAAFAVSTVVARFAPVRSELAFALGAHLFVPLWAGFACVLPLLGRRR
jgi:hypothetical protein